MLGDYINQEEAAYLDNLKTPGDYQYDPHIAADELGLPVELIEEFIGDFIQQANDFRDDLFDANLKEDFDEVHILSHKLKGVAANLRIEDMRQLMENAQHAKTLEEIEKSLTAFYRKLAALKRSMAKEYA
jgi:HPt (histidine-containing phosphotransfer) domain-containing protein